MNIIKMRNLVVTLTLKKGHFIIFFMLLPAMVVLYCIRLSTVTDMLYMLTLYITTAEGWQHVQRTYSCYPSPGEL